MEQKIEEILSKYPEWLRPEVQKDLREFAQSQAVEVIKELEDEMGDGYHVIRVDDMIYTIKEQFDLPL